MIAFVSDICVKPLQYSQVFFVQRYMVSCNISVAFNKNSFRMNKKRIMNISHQTYFCCGFWPFIYRLDFIIIFAGSRSRCLIERYCINFCQHAKKNEWQRFRTILYCASHIPIYVSIEHIWAHRISNQFTPEVRANNPSAFARISIHNAGKTNWCNSCGHSEMCVRPVWANNMHIAQCT